MISGKSGIVGLSGRSSRAGSEGIESRNPYPLCNCDETCNHLVSMKGFAELRFDKESVEGLVDGIRTFVVTARNTLDIEVGPLLQALNMIPS